MYDDDLLARLGISRKLAYGLFFQSILVILATIFSIWGVIELYPKGFTMQFITNIISLLVCISLLIYSFFGFDAEKNQEIFFIVSIILYIILIICGFFASSIDFKNPVSFLSIVTLISAIFFLRSYMDNCKSANFAMLLIIISGIIVVVFNVAGGMPWLAVPKYIIMPVSLGLTYFERAQRGKYDFKF